MKKIFTPTPKRYTKQGEFYKDKYSRHKSLVWGCIMIIFIALAFVLANFCVAQEIKIDPPISSTSIEELLTKVLDWLRTIIIALSMIFIVIGALLYITSAGNDKRMETAKSAITASLIGLAIGLAAPTFLKEITTILGSSAPGVDPNTKTFAEIALSTLEFLLSLVGVLGIIMSVIGGMAYLSSGGDEKRIDSAKAIIKYSIIGIIVALGALVTVTQLTKLIAS